MSFIDPKQESDAIEGAALAQISAMFPFKGRGGGGRTLELRGIRVGKGADSGDIRGQKRAKLYGRTWSTPVYADLEIKDSNGTIDRQEVKIASLPKTTGMLSYIVNGKEVHVENQWHLRPGAYAREAADGRLEVQFNPRGAETRIQFDPASRAYNMEYGKSQNVPLYSVLHALGVDHEDMAAAWGQDIAEANRGLSNPRLDLPKLYKGIYDAPPEDGTLASAVKGIVQKFAASSISPEVTSITLGKPRSTMDGETFLLASNRLLSMSRGESKPDTRDALHFKELWGLEDFIPFRLQESRRSIERKIGNNLSRKDNIREIVDSSTFGRSLLAAFSTSLAVAPSQVNPIDVISSQRKTTSMGPMGGIENEHKLKLDMRLVDNSHLGFLDPIPTPEGCYDPETEVFTSEGWVRWPSVTESTTFACLVDERLEFHPAEAIQRLPFSGDLLGVKTAVMEYLVTPAHRVLWRPWEERSPVCKTWRVDRADDVQHRWASKYRMTHGRLTGDDVSHFELPEVTGNNSSVRVPPIAIGDWAEFLGWYLSEGGTTYNEATSIYHATLYQSSTMSPRECRLIESLLRRLPFTWSCATDQATGKNAYTIAVKQLASYTAQFGKQPSRFIPDCMLTAPWHARERLLDALLLGDGRLGNHGGTQRVYTTTSARLASDVERLMISLGSAVSVCRYADSREERYRDVYEVRALKSTETVAIKSKGHYQTVPFDGTVYCASVPGGMLYVRRNGGRPIWSGNSMTGITLSLPVGTSKTGRQVTTNAYNMRTGKMESITPGKSVASVVAFPDQFTWENGKPKANSPLVQVSTKGNEFSEVAPEDVDYVLPSAQGMFTVSTNMIPFMQNDHGNRANFAAKQITQAIALVNPEQPLVQVHTGYGDPSMTWEKVLGSKFSTAAPVDGVVSAIGEDSVTLRTAGGRLREIQHYNNYPLNDGKSHLSSTPVVAVGDKVKAGQLLTDSNFTRDGTLAYGVNGTVGYLALPGSTFEDGIVISDTMAKKLSSTHMYQEEFTEERPITLNKEKFRAYMPLAMTAEQAKKLDDYGIIKPGMVVNEGDTLVAALRQSEQGEEQRILQGISKKLARPYSNASLIWDNEAPGTVVEVIRNGRDIKVQVKTAEAARVADKLTGRHGNKGVISRVLPDAEMPRRADGTRLDIVINPMAVGARINPGQIYETMMSKVAEKRGGPIAVTNFAADPDKQFSDVKGHWRTTRNKDGATIGKTWVEAHRRSYYHAVARALEAEGLTDREPLYDAKTGEELRVSGEKSGVLVGKQYILKLEHMASKKLSARGTGAGYEYDANMSPKGGGSEGAQRLGILGLYSILAHEKATNLLQEMQTIKSDRSQSDYWLALMSNEALPPMQAPFAYEKFVGYLKQLGVSVDRTGSELRLLPRTDKEVLEASNGEVDPSKIMTAKDMEPEEGGIFDEKITGGKGGSKWAHHKMGAPIMNPMYGQAVANLLGLRQKVVEEIASCASGITMHNGKAAIVPAKEATYVGGEAIKAMLSTLDPKQMLADAERDLPSATKSKVDDLVKRIRFLRPLVEKKVSPVDAYVMHNLAIMPPRLHPLAVLPSGDINWDDINGLYKQIGIISTTLRDMPPDLPDEYKHPLRADLYDGVKSIMGLGGKHNGPDGYKGILDIVAGSEPKNGYFAKALFSRKQDLSMRAVIVPAEDLALDEVGLPRVAAMSLFEPFVVRELVKSGYTPNEARQAVKDKTSYAEKALEYVTSTRPVLLKRDPALHKFSVMGFNVKLIPGKAIHIHPLSTGGFNADFDGDAMSVYVPVTDGAVREVYQMLPSRNLFNEASGTTMYQPALESQVGLYAISVWGEDKGRKFADPNQLLTAAKQKLLGYDEVVSLGSTKTTAGRVLLNSLMPKGMRDGPLLTSPTVELDKGGLQKLMAEVATKQPSDFAEFIDKFKDIGFQHTYKSGSTISMEDLRPLTEIRDTSMAKADGLVIRAMKGGMSGEKLADLRVEAYGKAVEEISAQAKPHMEKTKNAFYKMAKAGTKPSWDQLRQMVISPILLSDGHGRTIPVPVRNSFADGLSASEYWIAAHGARKGIIQKTGEVQKPGALNKKISATVVDMIITSADCGSRRGILLPASSKEVLDRYTADDVKAPGMFITKNTLITPAVASQMRAAGIDKVQVRSPLRCQAGSGLCGKCYGVHKNGKPPGLRENIGMMAGQSVGERSTQLVLKCSAGLVKVAGGLLPWSVAVEGIGMEVGADGVDTAAHPQDFDVYGKDGPTEAMSVERHAPFSPVCLVSTRTGAMVLVQGDHPMVAASAIRRGHSNRHVRLTGDRVYRCTSATPRDKELQDPPTRVVQAADLTREDALWVDYTPLLQPDEGYVPDYDPYIAGLYAGDGCLRYGNGTEKYEGVPVAIVFTQKDTNWAAISDRIKVYYGEQAGDAPNAVNVYSLEAARKLGRLVRSDYVASNGRRSQSKVLADDVSRIDREWLRGFLAGLIDTDGHVFVKSGATVASVCTTSIELAAQIQAICIRLGAFAKVNVTDDCPSRVGKGDYKTAFGIQIRFPAGYTSNSLKLGGTILPFRHALSTAVRGYDTVTLVREIRQWEGQVYDVKTTTSEYMSGVVQNHNSFHSGGVAGARELPRIDRLEQILNMYDEVPGSATLATQDATVQDVRKDPAGGWRVKLDTADLYVPQDRGAPTVRVGDVVKKGHPVSKGPINPRDLLSLTGLESVQSYMTKAMEDVYEGENLRRRNFEVVVKSLTNLAQVDDPGDHPDFLRTDMVSAAKAAAWNRENPAKKPVQFKPILKGLKTLPLTGTEDWLARMNFEQIKKTVQSGAMRGWKSDLHGPSPVPGLIFGAEFGKSPSDKPWAY